MKKIITLLLFSILHFFSTAQLHEFHFDTDIIFTEDKKFAFVYGFKEDSTFLVLKLDENFEEVAKINFKINNSVMKIADVKLINNQIYLSGIGINKVCLRVKIPFDLGSYKEYKINGKEFQKLGKQIFKTETNKSFYIEDDFAFYNYKIIGEYAYILYTPLDDAPIIPYVSMFMNIDANPKYNGPHKLVKYKINEEIIENYLFFKYEKVWEREFNGDFASKYDKKYLSYEEGAYTTHIVGINESENFIVLSLSDAKTKSRKIVCLDVKTNEIVNSVSFDKISHPDYYLSSFSIFYVNDKKHIVMDVGSINNERYIQLYDTKLNKIGNVHIAFGQAKSENDRLHIFESDNKTYYTRKFNSYFPTNFNGQINNGGASPSTISTSTSSLPISDGPDVLDVIISDSIISTNSFNKTIIEKCNLDNNTKFLSPNFIAHKGEFIHVGITYDKFGEKLTDEFLNFENCNKCASCEQKKGIDIYTHNYSSNQNALHKLDQERIENNSVFFQSKNEQNILYFKSENLNGLFKMVNKVYLIKMFE
jgi:hypothetical protein